MNSDPIVDGQCKYASEAVPRPLEAIAGFVAFLRDHGLNIGVAEHQALIHAALAIPVARHRVIEAAWRSVACHSHREWHKWDDLFERYWHPTRLKGQVRMSGQMRPSRDLRQIVQALHDAMGSSRPGEASGGDSAFEDGVALSDEGEGRRAQGGASRADPLDDRSLSQWLPQDLERLQRLADLIANRLRQQLTRRWHQHAMGSRLDIRRTMRASLRTGGVPVAPVWRRPRRERPKLFILVDVSRSMQTHAQLFLRIARAFVGAAGARVFVFHTRLAEVTPLLKRDSGTVQEKVNAVTAGFAGGTRIATSIADFHRVHARAQIDRGSRVWVLSDGFDADPPERLHDELERVRARGARITWFHPTVKPPTSEAMQPCHALIERFIPLATLRDLANAAALLK